MESDYPPKFFLILTSRKNLNLINLKCKKCGSTSMYFAIAQEVKEICCQECDDTVKRLFELPCGHHDWTAHSQYLATICKNTHPRLTIEDMPCDCGTDSVPCCEEFDQNEIEKCEKECNNEQI